MTFEEVVFESGSTIADMVASHRVIFRGFLMDDNGGTIIKVDARYYTGDWVYWDEFGKLLAPVGNAMLAIDLGILIPETIGQFVKVGTDGRPIFEHDIVEVHYRLYPYGDEKGTTETAEVAYDAKECKWYPMAWNEYCENCDNQCEIETMKVVGSKFDVPKDELKGE